MSSAPKHPRGSYAEDIIVIVEVRVEVTNGDGELPIEVKSITQLSYDPNDDIRDEVRLAAARAAEDLGAIIEPVAFKMAV